MTMWVRLGVVGRPHGIRGAVKLHLDNPKSSALRAGRRVRLILDGVPSSHEVASYGGGVLSLVGVSERGAAERLTHGVLEVARADLGDDVLLVDVIGRDVVDVDGRVLGRIACFHDNGAQPVAEVATPDRRVVLVPFVPPIVSSIGERVVLAPPPGLFDDDAIVVGDASDAGRDADDNEDEGAGT
jgi:16S rRNA processing protein RimM